MNNTLYNTFHFFDHIQMYDSIRHFVFYYITFGTWHKQIALNQNLHQAKQNQTENRNIAI
jgi:hypothetical protein